jgi:hypothetical protein
VPNRWRPVPVNRTGSTGNRKNRLNSKSEPKHAVQTVSTSIPTGSTGTRSLNKKTN